MSILMDKSRRREVIETIHKSDIFNQEKKPDEQKVRLYYSNLNKKIRDNLKSNIVFDIQDSKKETKPKDSFEPKYQYDNAFNMKLREFGGNDKSSKENPVTSSIGHFKSNQSKLNSQFDRKTFTELSRIERMLIDKNPNLTIREIENLGKNIRIKQKEAKKNENDYKSKVGSSARETYYNNLNSNIFNDKKKKAAAYKPLTNEHEKKKEANLTDKDIDQPNQIKAKPKGELSGWVNNLDWREVNTSQHFNIKQGYVYKIILLFF